MFVKAKPLLYKIFSLLSVIRGYNLLVLIAAQYLAAIFIFSEKNSAINVLFDWHLFCIIAATVATVSAGYIINNFYDLKADKINRPIKSRIDAKIKQSTKLNLYFFLNFLAFYFGWLVSYKAAIYFAGFIFTIWFYSHKLKKYPILGLLSVSILTISPFFAVLIYYKNFSNVIYVHASFLLLVIMTRELIKNLENLTGALANNYNTFAVYYGERNTKLVISFLLLLTLIPIGLFYNYAAIEYMKYYFYLASIVLFIVGIYLWKATKKSQYTLLHNILKVLLLVGVFSLIFIDKTLILDKVVSVLK